MKKLKFLLVVVCFYATVSAQTVTLRFEGTPNTKTSTRSNFAVDLDGTNYYSAKAQITGTAGARQLVITDLELGSHQLAVYNISNNSTVSNSNKGTPAYSNSFRLREGYDMVIAIRRNGQVTFTEKRKPENSATVSSTKTAMTDAAFDKLLQSTKTKWSQTSRYTAIKSAFTTKSNFFNTDQVGELLLLITAESKRLELAKLSYPKVTDPDNFTDVADLFNSQANKDNMEKFIRSKNPASTGRVSNEVEYNARPPLTTQQFNQLMQTAKNQYEQSGKYAVLRDAFKDSTTFYSTSQLRQLLTLITTENERLALAKLSYARVSDIPNFNSLYNLFTRQASRDELSNFIKYGEAPKAIAGQYSNRVAMSDGDFSRLSLKARLHLRQASTVEDVKEALADKNYYFSMEQIRSLLTLITSEYDRLALAKLAYHRATDPTTFIQLFDLFTTQASIDDLNNYIKSNRS